MRKNAFSEQSMGGKVAPVFLGSGEIQTFNGSSSDVHS